MRVSEVIDDDEAPGPSDEALVLRCQAGSHEDFELLVVRFELRIYRFLFGLVRNSHDAEDLTQVVFVKAWRSLQSFRSPGAFSAWLFTIAKRTAYNHIRDHKTTNPMPEEKFQPEGAIDFNDPSRDLAKKDDSGALWTLARRLKPNQFQALWLRYGEDFTIAEITRIMETNPIRVKVLLHRARANLAKILENGAEPADPSPTLRGVASPAGID